MVLCAVLPFRQTAYNKNQEVSNYKKKIFLFLIQITAYLKIEKNRLRKL